MDNFNVLLEFSFLLGGVITVVTLMSQSFMICLNVNIELKLSLS